MHLIFDNATDAGLFVAQADALLGYPITGQVDGETRVLTQTWAAPQKHPTQDQWAVPYGPEVDPILAGRTPVELGPDWDPNWIDVPPG